MTGVQTCALPIYVAEVLVAKQRHGPIGKVNLHFEGSTTKFSNLSKNQSIADKE